MYSRHQSGCGKSVELAQCSQCFKIFGRKDALKQHLIKCSPRLEVDGFVCDICQKTFNKNWLLNRQKTIHKKEEVVYPCETCGKTFSSSNRLANHIRYAHKTMEKKIGDSAEISFNRLLSIFLSDDSAISQKNSDPYFDEYVEEDEEYRSMVLEAESTINHSINEYPALALESKIIMKNL